MGKILSFGGGVNSVAILCQGIKGKVEFDNVVFADPGSEDPLTYQYIEEVVKGLCVDNGIPFSITGKPTLYDDCWKKEIIPYRQFRWCSDHYKIRPMRKWAKQRYGNNYTMILGYDAGETRRAIPRDGCEYPLFDMGINRNGCKKIIKKFGIPVPPKSGCFFCPFQTVDSWKKLCVDNKKLFSKAEALEKNCRAYPKKGEIRKDISGTFLPKVTLEQLRVSVETQTKLFTGNSVDLGRCVFCHS